MHAITVREQRHADAQQDGSVRDTPVLSLARRITKRAKGQR